MPARNSLTNLFANVSKFCASPHYLDPWTHYCLVDSDDEETGTLTKTAAVLPFPGLGTMSFLSALVSKAPATAFDNEAMALVLRVMWQNHIRKYFIIDTIFFFSYFFLWIFLIDSRSSATVNPSSASMSEKIVAITILALNTLFFVKEVVQSDLGRR